MASSDDALKALEGVSAARKFQRATQATTRLMKKWLERSKKELELSDRARAAQDFESTEYHRGRADCLVLVVKQLTRALEEVK